MKRVLTAAASAAAAGAIALATMACTWSPAPQQNDAATTAYSYTTWHHHHHKPAPTPTPTTPTPTPTQPTSTPTQPAPTGNGTGPTAGKKLVTSWSPTTLAHAPWSTPANQPGNCPAPNGTAHVNGSGWAEIDTTGATGDCVSIQSPGTLPVSPGHVYEAVVNFSSFHDWPSFWMYGPNWPDQGEIDAVEGGPGTSYVTWHQAGNHTIGPDAWDNQTVPYAGISHDIQPGVWTTVDIAFTATGVDVYYQGSLYVHIPETVTTSGNPQMYLTISEGSCAADGQNVCNGGTSPPGSVQVKSVSEYF